MLRVDFTNLSGVRIYPISLIVSLNDVTWSSVGARALLSLLHFPLLLSLDLVFDDLPVNRDLLIELLEAIIGFLLLVLFQESLAVSDYRVDMGLLGYGDIQGLVPLVHLNVHLDGPIVEIGTHQDLLRLINLLTVKGEGGVTSWLTGQLLYIVNKLDFISLINDCKGDL